MYYLNKYKEKKLKNYFPIKCIEFKTDGMQLGSILRFNTFYLKIYDADEYKGAYKIYAYLYDENNPEFIDIVLYNDFPNYASQYKYDDYLKYLNNHNRTWVIE